MRIVVLLGPPGAGKGTQAAGLAAELGLAHVATGDLFRAHVAAGTELGRLAQRYMERGQLVPDDVTLDMLLTRLAEPDAAAGAVLDGFPRTRAQAEALDRALAERGQGVEAALLIDVPEDVLVARLADRRICAASGHVYSQTAKPPRIEGRCDIDGSPLIQRADDRPETVRARLAQQLGPLREVVDHYARAGILRRIDGTRSIEAVGRALRAALDAPAGSPGPTGPRRS
jgi:adenylate kinase